ncbi:ABC transporter transmembrane domain-containing protein [Lysinibacillus sphaericus]|nr:ABC transporter transmembrane domain-containing protein [Lysinibacillus sphaericus]MED4545536.1 ABC transporter transmembrane domain-containing protein [Lysinibacillus sphaericus]
MSFVSGLFAILGAVVFLLWIDWKMILLLLIPVPLTIFVIYPLGEKMYAISKANQDELAFFSGRLGRILSNIHLVFSSFKIHYITTSINAGAIDFYEATKFQGRLSKIM